MAQAAVTNGPDRLFPTNTATTAKLNWATSGLRRFQIAPPSDVEVSLSGSVHDELETRLDVLAHELGQHPVGFRTVDHRHA